ARNGCARRPPDPAIPRPLRALQTAAVLLALGDLRQNSRTDSLRPAFAVATGRSRDRRALVRVDSSDHRVDRLRTYWRAAAPFEPHVFRTFAHGIDGRGAHPRNRAR